MAPEFLPVPHVPMRHAPPAVDRKLLWTPWHAVVSADSQRREGPGGGGPHYWLAAGEASCLTPASTRDHCAWWDVPGGTYPVEQHGHGRWPLWCWRGCR